MSLALVLTMVLLVPVSPLQAAQGTHGAATPSASAPLDLEAYQLVLLQRPEHPREYPEEKLAEIQRAHLAHLRELARAGKVLVAGPFGDQPDPRLRGLVLFKVGSVEEAKRLEEEDPAVKAGRLEVVAMTWYTDKGAIAFPMAEKVRGH